MVPGKYFEVSFKALFAILLKATLSFIISVYLSVWNNSVPTGVMFVRFDI